MAKVNEITLDVDTLTLGEMMAVEDASGKDITQLLSRTTGRRMLALFVHQLRNSDSLPRWSELGRLKVHDELPSSSDSSPDGGSTG
jgi:hypothetical protein